MAISWTNEWNQWSVNFYDSLPSWADTAKAHLNRIQEKFKGKMPADQALQLSTYYRCSESMREAFVNHQRILSLQTFEQHSLEMLKKALLDKATHDAGGNEITPEYVVKALQDETKAHSSRMQQWKKVHDEAKKARDLFHALHPRVRSIVDSLAQS